MSLKIFIATKKQTYPRFIFKINDRYNGIAIC